MSLCTAITNYQQMALRVKESNKGSHITHSN